MVEDDLLKKAAVMAIMECESQAGRKFQFLDGTFAPSRLVRHLIRGGKLLPNGDALLPGRTQTYRLAQQP